MERYPHTLMELNAWFPDEAACLVYLSELRWPDGFVCPRCGGTDAWQTGRDLWICRGCKGQTSITAGTIFHQTRKPLQLWFHAVWHITSQKYGANAMGLQRALDLGSYQTAWEWLHRLRRAMVRPGRDQLTGTIWMDETYIGGKNKPGKPGRSAAKGKTAVGIAVEDRSPDGVGRIRLQTLADTSAASLEPFTEACVAPGNHVVTDGWPGYLGLPRCGYPHRRVPSEEMKLPHLVASLLKRWLLGTYQGAVRPSHLGYYLDEFTFRFNRRSSASRGKLFYRLLQQAVMVDPVAGYDLQAPPSEATEDDFDVSADD